MNTRHLEQLTRRVFLTTGMIAVTVIVAVVAMVIGGSKADRVATPPDVALAVSGIPDYIKLKEPVLVSITYENHGGATGPLLLSADVPSNFKVEAAEPSATVSGRVVRWQLDGLSAGERGVVTARLQGSAPADTAGASYDYEGYEGYTAFEDGFTLNAFIGPVEGGSTLANAQAKADTGFDIEICQLNASPDFEINEVGTSHTVTAVYSLDIQGCAQTYVIFEIVTGPNSGMPSFTDNEAPFAFTYTSTVTGTDFIRARCEDCTALPSDVVKEWVAAEDEDDDPSPTRTPTSTPTRTPTPTFTPTATPGANLGGFSPPLARRDDPTPVPTPVIAAAAPPASAPTATVQTVRPPSTGDGGLAR